MLRRHHRTIKKYIEDSRAQRRRFDMIGKHEITQRQMLIVEKISKKYPLSTRKQISIINKYPKNKNIHYQQGSKYPKWLEHQKFQKQLDIGYWRILQLWPNRALYYRWMADTKSKGYNDLDNTSKQIFTQPYSRKSAMPHLIALMDWVEESNWLTKI